MFLVPFTIPILNTVYEEPLHQEELKNLTKTETKGSIRELYGTQTRSTRGMFFRPRLDLDEGQKSSWFTRIQTSLKTSLQHILFTILFNYLVYTKSVTFNL